MIKQQKTPRKGPPRTVELSDDKLERVTGGADYPPIVFKKRVDKISP